MSRYIIVSTPGVNRTPHNPFADLAIDDAEGEDTGCAWLFLAAPGVDDPESALRAAIVEYFASDEGRRVRRSERLEKVGWCDAIPWIADEVWERHGLSVFRHPDVERILLDAEEDLAEELPEWTSEASPAGAAS